MIQVFIDSLIDNLADVLTIAAVIGVVGGAALYWFARRRRVRSLRRRLNSGVDIPGKVKAMVASAANADVAEMGAIATVSLVDLAWQYSMAAPEVWDHISGPGADHLIDVVQNLDVLKSTLGDQLFPFADNVIAYLRGLEAAQVFGDLAGQLPVLGDASSVVLEAKGSSVVDSLAAGATAAEAKAAAAGEAGLPVHLPLVTVGFATYRAWRRSQQGAGLKRNVEFAAIEVTTRAGGGLLGGKAGGVIGTLIVPGVGTFVGTVAGAVAGAVGGALLGETVKKRHVQKVSDALNASLERLGSEYLDHPGNFERLTDVFREQEADYRSHLRAVKRHMVRYALPWRIAWPDAKLVLLQETVRLAEERLDTVREGTVEAVDRLTFMRTTGQRRELGVMLWSNPALCTELGCNSDIVGQVARQNERLRTELRHLGMAADGAAA
jgi:hypothetical protein